MRKTFKAHGDFEACHEAEQWLQDNGYSIGSMESDNPIGIKKGNHDISKWSHLTSHSVFGDSDYRQLLDGVIAEGDKRNGDVTVIIFDNVDSNDIYK